MENIVLFFSSHFLVLAGALTKAIKSVCSANCSEWMHVFRDGMWDGVIRILRWKEVALECYTSLTLWDYDFSLPVSSPLYLHVEPVCQSLLCSPFHPKIISTPFLNLYRHTSCISTSSFFPFTKFLPFLSQVIPFCPVNTLETRHVPFPWSRDWCQLPLRDSDMRDRQRRIRQTATQRYRMRRNQHLCDS